MNEISAGSLWQKILLRRSWLGWGAVVLVWFVVVYGGCQWVTSVRTARVKVHFDAELQIPLVPAAVLVYLSVNPLMWLSGWALDRPGQWRALALAMNTAITVAGIGFLLVPTESAYPTWQAAAPTEWHPLFDFTERLVGRHNWFPSLHVALAWICAAAYSRGRTSRWATAWYGWALAVSVATLLAHQHYLLDVAAGLALAWLCIAQVLRRSWPGPESMGQGVVAPETRDPAPSA